MPALPSRCLRRRWISSLGHVEPSTEYANFPHLSTLRERVIFLSIYQSRTNDRKLAAPHSSP